MFTANMRRIAIDTDSLPDQLCSVTVTMPADIWKRLMAECSTGTRIALSESMSEARVPNLELIQEEMRKGPVAGAMYAKAEEL